MSKQSELSGNDAFLSPEPVAYCIETPLEGWEIVSPARAATEPELRWRKMIALTDKEREAIDWIAENLRLTIGVDRLATLQKMLERLGGDR